MTASDVTKVKVCGITNLEDALAAVEAGADALGFVFAEEGRKRNRFIEPERAGYIIERLPPFITTVGVTVNAPFTDVVHCLSFVDQVQFHGDESPEDIAHLRHLAVKAFRAGPDFDPAAMNRYHSRAFLIDAYDPNARGGTGKTCDWDVARAAVEATDKPVILAGGLTPDNVADAVRTVHPYAVDVSGGVEAEPGKKDHERLRAFIDAAKTPLAG